MLCRVRRGYLVLVALGLAVLTVPAVSPGAGAAPGATGLAATGLSQSGRWLTDATGRVVIVHGLNQVFKVSPYEPSADGFGGDDAAFLAANGFNAMRVGVIWAAVEPQPGIYDDAYLSSIADTVATLAAHGIVSLLDFHQDLYNEKFQGEGAPAWAVQDGGLPNPKFGFPNNYFANLAENHAWDAFWLNAKASDGVGLQVHFARAWAHVAAFFGHEPAVAGYEVMNEPWPGTGGLPRCAIPFLGCPLFDSTLLTGFFRRVDAAIRAVDTSHTVYIEPNVLFDESDRSYIGALHDPHAGFSFHNYCGLGTLTGVTLLCPQEDSLAVTSGVRYAQAHNMPPLLTEFGATNDLTELGTMMRLADKSRLGWLEWAYTGNDITSSSPNGQALVLDPSQPPTGANVVTAKLKVLAEPYPQIVAGTPVSWSFKSGVFQLTYRTARVGTLTSFGAGAVTQVALPAVQYPAGYQVTVSGANVTSAPDATTLLLAARAGATQVTVTVSAA
jgi:endoglycosylceramidase